MNNLSQPTLQQLLEHLPQSPLYQSTLEGAVTANIGWNLSPEPYALTPKQQYIIDNLGQILQQYLLACQELYRGSLKPASLPIVPEQTLNWVRELFHKGKPSSLMTFSEMKRLRPFYQLVIRPDLLVTENSFCITEIDTCPGGIGFTAALQHAYSKLGFDCAGVEDIPKAFVDMLLSNYQQYCDKDAPTRIRSAHISSHTTTPSPASRERGQNIASGVEPHIAIIVSDDFGDYRLEFQYIAEQVGSYYPHIAVIHPKQLTLRDKELGYLDADNNYQSIQIVYRMFELYDLPNIPQIELLQYAIKKDLVFCTPPFKPYLEEKFTLALIHCEELKPFWQKQLPKDEFELLQELIPESWIYDPTALPAQAQIVPAFNLNGKRHKDMSQLGTLSQKERQLVLKPSSFSRLAWGSHGIAIGHDLSQQEWQKAVDEASASNLNYLLQRFSPSKVEAYQQYNLQSGEVINKQGRTRLCPYYFVSNHSEVNLVGVLSTTCPKDKKMIHGMRDGVMRPAQKTTVPYNNKSEVKPVIETLVVNQAEITASN